MVKSERFPTPIVRAVFKMPVPAAREARTARSTSSGTFARPSRLPCALARSIADLQVIIKALKAKGASLRTTEGTTFDTGSAMGKAFLDMLGVFAEFETNLRRERQMEGIAKAKLAGVYKGRKPSIDRAAVETLKAQGFGPTAIAKRLGIGRASVYRVLAD